MKNLLESTRKADIRFYPSGKIEISSLISKQLKLAAGDKLNIGLDNNEYYLYATHGSELRGRHEAQCWPTNRGGNHLRAYSKRLCEAVIGRGKNTSAALNVGAPVHHPYFGTMLPLIIQHRL